MDKKICVYAIAKNEIKFIDRWYNSVKEADYVCVLDTGSDDGSFEKFQQLGIITKQKKYKNFRFDEARNESLKLIPDDAEICVCVDIDEFFNPGWSEILKNNWGENTKRVRYRYTWNFNADGSEGVVFMADKIHKNHSFVWTHPVHEILVPINKNSAYETIDLPQIQLNHKADNTKSRSSYLPLLELSVQEHPEDDRNVHYLGREYMYYGKWNDAIDMLIRHLKLPSATWKDERCASMRFIARCYKNLKRFDESEMWLSKAIVEAPYLREPYMEMALLQYELKDWKKIEEYCLQALEIKYHPKTYINETFSWNETVYDLLSLSYYYQNNYKKSFKYIKKALKINPNDKRLKNNYKIIKKALNEKMSS